MQARCVGLQADDDVGGRLAVTFADPGAAEAVLDAVGEWSLTTLPSCKSVRTCGCSYRD
jgi:hypothetical protein